MTHDEINEHAARELLDLLTNAGRTSTANGALSGSDKALSSTRAGSRSRSMKDAARFEGTSGDEQDRASARFS